MSPLLRWNKLRQARGKTARAAELTESLVTLHAPDSAASEAYRRLRTNLLYSRVDNPPKVILVTSAGPREGKSSVCANLGVVLAQGNKNTLIVDCDFRKPSIHTAFELRNLHGLVDTLVGSYTLQDVLVERMPELKVLCTGPMPPNPAELLSSSRMSEFFASVREGFDYILVDTPPIRLVSDPLIVAAHSDGALLVVDAQNTRKAEVRRAMRGLEAVGARVLGTVMSNIPSEDAPDYYYYR